MFACFRRIKKCQLRQLMITCFVLSVIKVYWESLDQNVSNHIKSYSFRLFNNLDFISSNLTISYEDAQKFSNHRYLINHEDKCANEDMLLLLLVKSSPENFERRQAIRLTWGNEAYIQKKFGVTVRVLFALGIHPHPVNRKKFQRRLILEDKTYQDLIQQDFLDTFHNLTIKLLLQLGWTHTYCKHARFVMSADDDIFVHMPNLIRYLQEMNRTSVKDFWIGKVHRGSPPIRKKESKYYVSHEIYPWFLYPDYTPGAGYVISRDVASRVYQASLTLNASIYIDDVFMGICANAIGILPKEHVFFSGEGRAPNHVCIYNQMMTSHGHVKDFHELWKLATDPEVQQVSSGLFGKLYCTITKIRLLCSLYTLNTYPCKAAFF
ncbi:lactosylceramide 1,3-N-acetyl-beta-D-glucosaminyltransferase B [Tachysurus fulvidraco]|uniref:lactosylceramide 1,3-N-acetyl-beta-D-glucosaminyltransferase B n=1 Tax=Tachysurus fulvidraco TaxID=1234273 RepID=UPI000F4D4F8B|nr:lactosylceramide 1,3-N-acetyl-beta-D-glucosaminyltransferase B [Tachysurus fulvidraco]XP_027004368.1 lactosylceramide 1,3-N-acetyl-beta-D-glucosaminyltransferase B [Tachysurus fulvidraco]XP_027004369.1 lactosylceramide 1,3-N-acetyl-beta-D-glucosaminyltransferase B [Tachysurus fulvidraco]